MAPSRRSRGWTLVALLIVGLVGAAAPALAGDLQAFDPKVALPLFEEEPAQVFFGVRNNGKKDRKLLGASSPKAARVEIRQAGFADGEETGRVVGEWVLPGGSTTFFMDGGVFLALVGAGDLSPGDVVPIELRFDSGDTLSLKAVVKGE